MGQASLFGLDIVVHSLILGTCMLSMVIFQMLQSPLLSCARIESILVLKKKTHMSVCLWWRYIPKPMVTALTIERDRCYTFKEAAIVLSWKPIQYFQKIHECYQIYARSAILFDYSRDSKGPINISSLLWKLDGFTPNFRQKSLHFFFLV